MKREKGYMSWKTFEKAVNECRGKVKTSYLHQIGEPLLHPDLLNFINYAEDAGIRSSISTNCVLLDEKKSIGILASDLSEIVLCIDSLKPDVFASIRRGGNLQVVAENIFRFIRLRQLLNDDMKVIVQMIAMKENVGEHEHFKKVFSMSGIDETQVKGYSTFAGAMSKGESPPSRLATCSKPYNNLTIQWNGDMVICCRDYDGVTKMGNVNNTTIAEVWNSEEYATLRKTFKQSNFCKEC
jgi:MoaA/NifB/PqqE/SkfB family radical SAM enzyme